MELTNKDYKQLSQQEVVELVFCVNCEAKKKGLNCKVASMNITTQNRDKYTEPDEFYFHAQCVIEL